MNKKKLITLLVAGVLTVGVVGGTFAWFTSSDSVSNKFSTAAGEGGSDVDKDGIEVWEKFDTESATKVTPGTEVNKDVQAKNTASYDQFIRVKIDPQWTEVPHAEGKVGTSEGIKLNFTNLVENVDSVQDGQWIKSGDYYYYVGKVASGKFTNQLLDSVTLQGTIGNEFKGAKYEVNVYVESVQASNNAILDQWKEEDQANNAVLEKVNGSSLVEGQKIDEAQKVTAQ